jgi:hypothetical protein
LSRSELLSIPLDDVESGKEGFPIAAKKLGFLKFYSNEIKGSYTKCCRTRWREFKEVFNALGNP